MSGCRLKRGPDGKRNYAEEETGTVLDVLLIVDTRASAQGRLYRDADDNDDS